MDYAELVKELRDSPANKRLMIYAADAIEQLQAAYKEERNAAVELTGELASKPRWIPVTERLPDAECGDSSKNVFVTDGQDVAISSWFNGDDWASYWSYTGIEEVTHWQPLPEPPKEEP